VKKGAAFASIHSDFTHDFTGKGMLSVAGNAAKVLSPVLKL